MSVCVSVLQYLYLDFQEQGMLLPQYSHVKLKGILH